MAITNVPKIYGPDFGGVIYGLTLTKGFSEPSKIVLDIISKDGTYDMVQLNASLNTPTVVSFGDFIFYGYIWSYEQRTTSSEKTLQVTIIDRSIVLDRHCVLLWKSGLLGINGTNIEKKKIYDFSSEFIYIPYDLTAGSNQPFKKVNLSKETIKKNAKVVSAKKYILQGNAILLGEEKFQNACEIPSTWYSFDDLSTAMINGLSIAGNYPSDTTVNFKTTHEGSLRSVLSDWCNDLGYDFLWDYSKNSIYFYDAHLEINDLSGPIGTTSSSIIAKTISNSMEGTYKQYGIGYTQYDRNDFSETNYTISTQTLTQTRTVPVKAIAHKMGEKMDLSVTRSDYSSFGEPLLNFPYVVYSDTQSDQVFLGQCMLGHFSPELRSIYCIQKEVYEGLGYSRPLLKIENSNQLRMMWEYIMSLDGVKEEDKKFFTIRRDGSYNEGVSGGGLEESDDPQSLVNKQDFILYLTCYDENKAQKWKAFEDAWVENIGRYHMIADRSGTSFFCSPTQTLEFKKDVSPSVSLLSTDDPYFPNMFMYADGGGGFDYSPEEIRKKLRLDDTEVKKLIQSCVPKNIKIDQNLRDELISPENGIVPEEDMPADHPELWKYDTVLIVTSTFLTRYLTGFGSELKPPTASLVGKFPTKAEIEAEKKKEKEAREAGVQQWIDYKLSKKVDENTDSLVIDVGINTAAYKNSGGTTNEGSTDTQKCPDYEKVKNSSSCISAEELARKNAIINAGGYEDNHYGVINQNTSAGSMTNGAAVLAAITLKSAYQNSTDKVLFHGPSHSPRYVSIQNNITLTVASLAEDAYTYSEGAVGNADDVEKIFVVSEDVTDPEEDGYKTKRVGTITRPEDIDNSSPVKKVSLSFANKIPDGVVLRPLSGLDSMDISLNDQGFITQATFSTKPYRPKSREYVVRKVQSARNRSSY